MLVGSITRETLKIKKTFPKLYTSKIENIQKIISRCDKSKSQINMTTRGLSRKQVIILMNQDNIAKFIRNSINYIVNINRLLKNIKSNCKVDYIQTEKSSIVIVTNKVAFTLDLQTMEKYIKNSKQIDADHVDTPWLPQSKLYLKIIGLLYFIENSNTPVTLDIIKNVIRSNHIFNDILITLCSRIIKVFPKLDMTIIWLDI